ncbi:hypothetical protein [Jatrophihabitans fulvus]
MNRTDLSDVPTPIRAACGVLVLEALALFAAAAFYVYGTAFGHPNGVARSLVAALMAAGVGVGILMGASGLLKLSPAARSPMVVVQLLALPVAYSLAFQAGRVLWGGPILIAAVAVIYLLFTPPARQALDRDPL